MIFLFVILIFWLIAPLVLIPWITVLLVKYNHLKKKYEFVLKTKGQEAVPPLTGQIGSRPDAPLPQDTRPMTIMPPAMPLPLADGASKPETAEKPHKNGKNAVNATLITGVLLVLAAGIIFATTTWRLMPDFVKVLLISSLAVIFFATSYLAEKRLKLKMTGMAFYHLGCLFVPVAILAVGYFNLFGVWFSIYGEGKYWLQFAMAVSFGVLAVMGYRHYKVISFYYVSWAASGCAVWLLSRGVGNDWARCWLWLSFYVGGIVTWAILKKNKQWMLYIHPVLTFACVIQAILIYFPGRGGFTICGVCMILLFGIYHFSGRILPISFDTPVSQCFFSTIGVLASVFVTALGDYGIGLCLYLGIMLCQGLLFWEYKSLAVKIYCAWFITGIAGLGVYPVIEIMGKYNIFSKDLAYLAVFTFGFLFSIAVKMVLKGGRHSGLFRHPVNCLAGMLAASGIFLFGLDGLGIFLLWELLILWIVFRKNEVYAILAAALAMFLPATTLWILHTGIHAVFYGLAVAMMGLIYYWFLSAEKWRWFWIFGIYAGFGFSCTMYVASVPAPLVSGIALLAFVAAADILGFRKDTLSGTPTTQALGADALRANGYGNLDYCGVNVMLIPITALLIFENADVSGDQLTVGMLIMAVIMMAAGRKLFPLLCTVGKQEGQQEYRVDYLGLSAVAAVIPVCSQGTRLWIFIGLVFLGLWFLNWYGRQSRIADHISMVVVLAIFCAAWRIQPFFAIPELYGTEYMFLGIGLTCAASGIIWKGKEKYVDIYWFLACLCFVCLQGLDCLVEEKIWDVMFLGVAMLLVLMIAYKKRELRWLSLSLVTLTGLVLYASRGFWLNIAWWIYLLLAGLLLIGIAAFHEYRKRDGVRQRHGWKEFLDDWRW